MGEIGGWRWGGLGSGDGADLVPTTEIEIMEQKALIRYNKRS